MQKRPCHQRQTVRKASACRECAEARTKCSLVSRRSTATKSSRPGVRQEDIQAVLQQQSQKRPVSYAKRTKPRPRSPPPEFEIINTVKLAPKTVSADVSVVEIRESAGDRRSSKSLLSSTLFDRMIYAVQARTLSVLLTTVHLYCVPVQIACSPLPRTIPVGKRGKAR
jgi:hypothetical protein